jgi:ABC-2 type transport system permease protein
MATIRERGYYHWEGRLEDKRVPWWPITRTGIQLAFKKRLFKFFFAWAFLPSVVALAFTYISERLEDFKSMVGSTKRLITIDPKFFMGYVSHDALLFFIIMVLVFAGAGLVADDLKHNSLQVYFSRPLKKKDYLVGKMSVVFFFVLVLTLVPALLVVLFKLIFAGSFKFLLDYPWIILSIVAYTALLTVFLAFYTLLLSALSKNSRYVMIQIFMVYLFSDVLYGILFSIFRTPYMALFSIKENLQQIAAFVFLQKPAHPVPVGWSFLILASLCAVSAWVLQRKIRGVEVIR